MIQAMYMGIPWPWATPPAYAPNPKKAAVANEGYPVNPPMKFQERARTQYSIMMVARRMK
jgi:hypothetical protein